MTSIDWLNPDELIEFIDQLKAAGYKIDISKYIAAQDLILILIARGENLDSPESLRNLLAPIFCSSPTEQVEFHHHFDNWVKLVKQSSSPTVPGIPDEVKPRKFSSVLAIFILILMFTAFTGISLFYQFIKQIPNPNPTTNPNPAPSQLSTTTPNKPQTPIIKIPLVKGPLICVDKIIVDTSIHWMRDLAFFFVPSMIFLIWKFSSPLLARRLFLQRYGITEEPELHNISIAGVEQNLFPRTIFIQIARNLRRRISIPSNQLDIEKTIDLTLRRGGWLTPIYRSYQTRIEYLFLVNRNSFQDHQAQFVEEMIQRLQQDNVSITSYFFDDDPLICFPSDSKGSPIGLDEIVTKYSQHYLVVVSDTGNFFSAISGQLESWVSQLMLWEERFVLTPKPRINWGDREEELAVEQEFILLPATLEGLQELGQRFYQRYQPHPNPIRSSERELLLPEGLIRPRRWLERNSPEPEKVTVMLDLVEEYLGKDGFYWFCACAVFPELRWNITIYLGDVLRTEEGKSLLESSSLTDLTRLPWFRYGYIPDWLRVDLIKQLTPEQDQAIRSALQNLLERVNESSEDGLNLSIGTKPAKTQSDKLLSKLTQMFSGRVSENSPLQDYLFLDFMTKPSPLALKVPENFSRLISNPKKASLVKGNINRRTTFKFEVITVNTKGEIINRQRGQAKSFIQQLGNNIVLEMVEILGNSFPMGSPSGEKGRYNNEEPQHIVNVSAFLMGKFAVTQEQYQQVMGNNPSRFKGFKRPVETVSWNDAVEFCKKLSQKTGLKYRLPSESEWEYACRAGTTTPFHFGETITSDLANYDGNYVYASEPKGKFRQETTTVGSFPPNAFGLYDMHGNVWEWCIDNYHSSYQGAPSDGSQWVDENDNQSRMLRGGSWLYLPEDCRSANRYYDDAGDGLYSIGFRVVCSGART